MKDMKRTVITGKEAATLLERARARFEGPSIHYGTPVRFLANLGAVERGMAGRATKFVGTATAGQTGLYLQPLPGIGEDDWHVLAFGAWDVPAHRSQFEELESA
jgi:hypothetical protein